MDDFIVICEPFSRTNLNERDWQIGGVIESPARRRASARMDSYEFERTKRISGITKSRWTPSTRTILQKNYTLARMIYISYFL